MDDKPPPFCFPRTISYSFLFEFQQGNWQNVDIADFNELEVVTFIVPHTLRTPSTGTFVVSWLERLNDELQLSPPPLSISPPLDLPLPPLDLTLTQVLSFPHTLLLPFSGPHFCWFSMTFHSHHHPHFFPYSYVVYLQALLGLGLQR